jgi:tetratricopeptide (TPR) repeat protein
MYSENIEEEVKLLIRAVRSTQPRFVAVEYNHYDLVRRTKKELEATYPTRRSHSFSLGDVNPETFASSIIDCKDGFIFIEKFELLFTKELQSLAIGFNQRRDLFSAYPLQIILFIPEGNENLKQFQKTLPDIFSITNPFIQLHQLIERSEVINPTTLDFVFSDVNEAKQEIKRVEERLKDLANTTDSDTLTLELTGYLAQAYKFIGDYEQSEKILEKLLAEISQNKINASADTIMQIKSSLATTLKALGNYEGAMRLLEEVITFAEKTYGQNHPLTAASYSNLAALFRETGLLVEARRYIEKVVRSYELNYGESHSMTLTSYSNLALVLVDLNDLWSAKSIFEKVVEFSESSFGKNALHTAKSYMNLASLYQRLGNYQDTKKILHNAYEIFNDKLGNDHPITKTVKQDLESLGTS